MSIIFDDDEAKQTQKHTPTSAEQSAIEDNSFFVGLQSAGERKQAKRIAERKLFRQISRKLRVF